MKALLCGTKTGVYFANSGAYHRVSDISRFLVDYGFSVETVDHPKKAKRKKYDLTVMVSFATARFINQFRTMSDFLWLDATDSWTLTHNSLNFREPLTGKLRLFRDFVFLRNLRRVDMLTFCSKRDKDLHLSDHSSVFHLNHKQPTWRPLSDRGRRLVFVGDGKYRPNFEAAQLLYEVCVEENIDLSRLFFFGRNFSNFSRLGINVDENSSEEKLYGSRDIHLSPITSGAGVKYKSLTPLSLGLSLVSTAEGANGIEKSTPGLIICDDAIHFGKKIIQVTEGDKMHFQREMPACVLEPDDSSAILETIKSLFH
jgi:hypothetical protein